ncbi:hypothetical protein Tco_0765252 [Tanacetum coccineum]
MSIGIVARPKSVASIGIGAIGPPRPSIDGWHNSSIDQEAGQLGLTTGGGPLFGGGGGPTGGGPILLRGMLITSSKLKRDDSSPKFLRRIRLSGSLSEENRLEDVERVLMH